MTNQQSSDAQVLTDEDKEKVTGKPTTDVVAKPSGTVQTLDGPFDPYVVIAQEFESQGDMRAMILSRIALAETPDDVFAMFDEREAVKWLNIPVQIRDFVWNTSDYEEGSRYYAICEVVRLDTGEPAIASYGGENCVMQLWAWRRQEAFPINAVCVESKKETKDGYHPRHFAKVTVDGDGNPF